jgi:hypothetical protein
MAPATVRSRFTHGVATAYIATVIAMRRTIAAQIHPCPQKFPVKPARMPPTRRSPTTSRGDG